MVPRRGLEPPRPCERQHLKLVRLPIPPSGHGVGERLYGAPIRCQPLQEQFVIRLSRSAKCALARWIRPRQRPPRPSPCARYAGRHPAERPFARKLSPMSWKAMAHLQDSNLCPRITKACVGPAGTDYQEADRPMDAGILLESWKALPAFHAPSAPNLASDKAANGITAAWGILARLYQGHRRKKCPVDRVHPRLRIQKLKIATSVALNFYN